MTHTGRKILPHDFPFWVDPERSVYFVTICCRERGVNQLCLPGVAEALLDSARVYVDLRKWFPLLFLLMPDHLHMLVSFARGSDMNKVVTAWKRYAATHHGINWQRGFFEHRLRAEESVEEKAGYIMQNPVRAGLAADGSSWPHVFRAG